MNGIYASRLDTALYGISENITPYLSGIDPLQKSKIQEIRLRANKPLAVTVNGKNFYVTKKSFLQENLSSDTVLLKLSDIEESFKKLIRGSVYSHLNEIKEGYIMMRYGHRAGICGSFTKTGNMSHISSINIRISREIIGSADTLIKNYRTGGVLIAGPPGSGKTTLLRDFIRQLSDGTVFPSKRVCVIDTRGEISASFLGESFNDLGKNTDVLIGYEKAKGCEMAIRTMFPDIIAFDEFGTVEELKSVSAAFLSGADIILTAHIQSEEDLYSRKITKELLESNAIKTVVTLSGSSFNKMSIKTLEQVKALCG